MTIGDRLRKARKDKEMTAKELSEASGIPEKTIYRIETNEVEDPKVKSLKPLIQALECSADEILFDINQLSSQENLKNAFNSISKLNEEDQITIQKVINKFVLACVFESELDKSQSR